MSTEYILVNQHSSRLSLVEHSLKFDLEYFSDDPSPCGGEDFTIASDLTFDDLRTLRDNIDGVLDSYQEATPIHIQAKHHSKDTRQQEAIAVLDALKIDYRVFNQGSHFIIRFKIEYKTLNIHYWPTTGKWHIPELQFQCTHETRFLEGLLTYMRIPFIKDKQ